MPIAARYAHTNLIARDWRSLARFYQEVFGCTPVPPERDFQGPQFDALTGFSGARLRGMHLRLPGYGDAGPTLELFEYTPAQAKPEAAVNRHGYGHIAFVVDDVALACDAVVQAGGRPIGAIVTLEIAGGARVTVCYMTDPEGNIIELQSWFAAGLPADEAERYAGTALRDLADAYLYLGPRTTLTRSLPNPAIYRGDADYLAELDRRRKLFYASRTLDELFVEGDPRYDQPGA